jgi:hypothetical protein
VAVRDQAPGMIRRTPLARTGIKPAKEPLPDYAAEPKKARSKYARTKTSGRGYALARRLVFERDGHRCVVGGQGREHTVAGGCVGGLTFHHRRKRSAQGADTVDNGATLCLGHNQWIEDNPAAARLNFPALVVREGDPEWEQLGRRAQRRSSSSG